MVFNIFNNQKPPLMVRVPVSASFILHNVPDTHHIFKEAEDGQSARVGCFISYSRTSLLLSASLSGFWWD